MISYTYDGAATAADFHKALLAKIAEWDLREKRKKPWPDRAAGALKKFAGATGAEAGAEVDPLWSEIKPVYADLQLGKCAFCERRLGKDELIAYEQDMEHFRPKKGVAAWPPATAIGKIPWPADVPRSKGTGAGYRKLPYHELNYIVACKTCNTRCKGNFFPIAGKHGFEATDPLSLGKLEKPYLIYPLGGLDEEPERLVTFIGFKAVPAKKISDPLPWNRGRVTIHFFLLNDPTREDQLFLERATRLDALGGKIEEFERSQPSDRDKKWGAVLAEGSALEPHANCVRSMIRLYAKNQPAAWKLIDEARAYRLSKLDLHKWEQSIRAPRSRT